jgi:glycerol uptake facilitator-like aquaporin
MVTLRQSMIAEFVGSMFLVIAAISPGILGMDVLGAGLALSVLLNAIAVGFVLFALIETFGPLSGSNFNPAVTLALLFTKETTPKRAVGYISAQMAGGFIGLLCSHLMFYDTVPTLITISENNKTPGLFFAEFIGAFLLLTVIYGCVRGHSKQTSMTVGFVVGGMLITTASTMYANPMVAFVRVFTYSISGIAPLSALFFIIAEILGALTAAYIMTRLYPTKHEERVCDPYNCTTECATPIMVLNSPQNGK